jgi:preprotein translocase subunit SecD
MRTYAIWVFCGLVLLSAECLFFVQHSSARLNQHPHPALRVVLRIPSYGEFDYQITTPISATNFAGFQQIGQLKAKLTTAVRKQLGWKSASGEPTLANPHDPASQALQIDFTGEQASIHTNAHSAAEALAQLARITTAMRKVFPAPKAFQAPKPGTVFRSAKSMQDHVRLILEKRVNPDGTRTVKSADKDVDEVVLEIPDEKDPAHVKDLLTADGHLSFALLPDGYEVAENPNNLTATVYDASGKEVKASEMLKYAVTVLDGKDLEPNSKMTYDRYGRPDITFSIKGEANQRHFGAITEGNLHRKLAIVLGAGDSAWIVTAPVIQGRIDRGGVITGYFNAQQATDMATLLNAGALPVELQLVESRLLP